MDWNVLHTASITAAVAALVGGMLPASGGPPRPAQTAVASEVAAAKTPAGQITVIVRGDRLGQRARVTIRGLKGPAAGTKRVLRVGSKRTVKRLARGRYRVSGATITAGDSTATTAAVRLRLTRRHGGVARLTYRATQPPTAPPADSAAPGPVSSLRVDSVTPTSIGLAWTNPPDTDLGSVIVRRSQSSTAPGSPTEGNAVQTPSAAATAVTDTGLSPQTTYSYAVFTRDLTGNTGEPATITATTRRTLIGVASGGSHTCMITTGGAVWCWGANGFGQLGDATVDNRLTPVRVTGVINATAITAGSAHTCALLADGSVRCWGANDVGQLGDGTLTPRATPVAVPGLGDVVTVQAGDDHTCAVQRNRRVMCWGWNANGQLGDGTTVNRPAPVEAAPIDDAVGVTAGRWHTCALFSEGAISCWGDNTFGKLGDGSTTNQTSPNTTVWAINDATAITAGNSHTCARLEDGTVKCWGWNEYGQLGDGTTDDRYTPATTIGIGNAVSVTAGHSFSCARLADGTAACWGRNRDGTIGDGTRTDRIVRVAVPGLTDVTAISAKNSHTCAVMAEQDAVCWGRNDYGELGDGTTVDRITPTAVAFG